MAFSITRSSTYSKAFGLSFNMGSTQNIGVYPLYSSSNRTGQ